MEMSGQQRIPASRETVWAALNDPEILKACIPGCTELTKTSETQMTAVAVIKVGPVSAKFQGAVTLSDLDPPNGYRITGEGQGGVAGFAKGSAVVRLEEDAGETLLDYQVSADIGGKLAQLGGRLIDATARKMSDAFFRKFSEEIQRRHEPQEDAAAPKSTVSEQAPKPAGSMHHESRRAGRSSPALVSDIVQSPTDTTTRVLLGAILAAVVALGLWLVTGRSGAAPLAGNPLPQDLLFGVLLLIVAVTGYLLGRSRNGASPVGAHLDRESFEALLKTLREDNRGH